MAYYLGIDLGGTNIVAGVVDGDYRLLQKSSRPTLLKRSFEEIVADMAAAAKEALAAAGLSPTDIAYVGIGAPSAIEPATQRMLYANNLGWKQVDVPGEFKKSWDIPVRMANDADCAALGECLAGAAKPYGNILMITLGTGVGGGIVQGNKLYLGGDGFGVEPGHILLVEDGFPCTCGRRGCLEAYASVTALIRQTIDIMNVFPHSLMWEECGHDLNKVEGRTAFGAARRGDEPGRMVVEGYIRYLSDGLASMVTLLRPQAIIIGGGVSNEGEYLLVPVRARVAKTIYGHDVMACPDILKAQLGNDAGIIGAALLGV